MYSQAVMWTCLKYPMGYTVLTEVTLNRPIVFQSLYVCMALPSFALGHEPSSM